jgi:hypothetical protein
MDIENRHLIHPQHAMIVEVALVHPTAAERDVAPKRGCKAVQFPSPVNASDLKTLPAAPACRAGRNGVVRFQRRVSFGNSLYLQVMPTGRLYWHYRYRFEGRQKQLSLGGYPYVPVESAKARRHAARHLLEAGGDPGSQKQALRRINVDPV